MNCPPPHVAANVGPIGGPTGQSHIAICQKGEEKTTNKKKPISIKSLFLIKNGDSIGKIQAKYSGKQNLCMNYEMNKKDIKVFAQP